MHNRFLIFISFIFKMFLNEKDTPFLGMKFCLKGRISGKMRKSVKIIQQGDLSLQKYNQSTYFSKEHVYTSLGAFGLKLWITLK